MSWLKIVYNHFLPIMDLPVWVCVLARIIRPQNRVGKSDFCLPCKVFKIGLKLLEHSKCDAVVHGLCFINVQSSGCWVLEMSQSLISVSTTMVLDFPGNDGIQRGVPALENKMRTAWDQWTVLQILRSIIEK